MDCDRFESLLFLSVDRELEGSDRVALEEHIGACAACRDRLAVLCEDDALCREALGERRAALPRLAERTIARLRQEDSPGELPASPGPARFKARRVREGGPPPPRRRVVPGWAVGVAAGVAAGFLVAVLVFRPWSDRAGGPDDPASSSLARLAYATGDGIEARAPSAADWAPLRPGGDLVRGSRIRTAPGARCELLLADGSLVRLDATTELVLASHRTLELAQGRLWTRVEHGGGNFSVDVPGASARVTALGTAFEVATRGAEEARVVVLEGTTRVAALDRDDAGELVEAGEAIEVVGGELRAKEAVHDLLLATRWMHEILVLKGRDDPELTRRIDDLFAQIGEQKMAFLYEEEIRALGDHCAVPMARYLLSERSAGHTRKRSIAARILADVAPPWSVPDLIELLGDDQPEVRLHAERALLRLAEREGGRSPAEWRDAPPETVERAQEEWRAWWEASKDRFPPGP